jgi:trk system potassium uptake protein TrkH
VSRSRPGRIGRPRRLALDLGGSLALVGLILRYLSLSSLVPAAVALGYGEPVWPFLAAGAVAAATGFALERAAPGRATTLGFREGYVVISLTWLFAAVYGTLPYVFSGEAQLDRPVDAFFESMSGFSTTGSTVLVDVEALDHSLLLWRALTQWLGGMGIVVLALAILPRLRIGGRQLLESEMPGPDVEGLATRIRETAQRLWLLYVAITAVEALVLAVLGWSGVDDQMDPFRAVAQALTTLPTGGFSTEANSIAAFSAATQWVIVVFMAVAGVNFALTYRAVVQRTPSVLPRDEELRIYVGLLALAGIVLTVDLWAEGIATGEAAVREGVFQGVSLMTTTGFTSANFGLWTPFAWVVLIGLLFIGGSAGSTSGSVKVIRHVLMGKILRREMALTVHPELVRPIRFNGRVVDERTLRAVTSFVLVYIGIFIVATILLVADARITGLDLQPLDAIAATATTLSNTGPGLGFAGPDGSFEPFSDFSKLVLAGVMWLGRLEVIPIVVLFSRSYWRA